MALGVELAALRPHRGSLFEFRGLFVSLIEHKISDFFEDAA